jgi:UDP-N-acetylmuramyl pentapeptide phosphotransferase/UDP-N-acetylglucosamine-1-phosphate transferase
VGVRWTIAFIVATWSGLVGTAVLRRLARRKIWSGARASGGIAIAGAVLFGSLAAPSVPSPLAIAFLGSLLLLGFALLREKWALPGWTRLAGEVVAAIVVVGGGIRAEATGVTGPDVVFTVLWLIILAEAVRGLDLSDGLAAGISGVAALGIFALAAFGNQPTTATLAAALAGSCLGFFAYNARPASVFMSDAGSLFLGFTLGILTIELNPSRAVTPPGTFLVPLLLVGIPLLDLSVVSLARFRRGLSIGSGRRDRLVHRLRAAGISPRGATRYLVGTEALLVAVALFAGRGVLPVLFAVTIGGTVIAALALALALAANRDMYEGETRRRPRWQRRAIYGFIGGLALLLVVTGVLSLDANRLVTQGRDEVQAGLAAAHVGDARTASEKFAAAADAFDGAASRLDNPVTWPGMAVPVVAPNLDAVHQLAVVGRDLARAGSDVASRTDPKRLKVRAGTFPLDEIRRLTPALERAARAVAHAVTELESVRHDPSLVGPVKDVVNRVGRQLDRAHREADNSVVAAKLAPALFGGDGPRRYFLAVQNPAELRGTGGLIGNWGILTAVDGKIALDRFERTALLDDPASTEIRTISNQPDFDRRYGRFSPLQIWQNLNMSPDFPTVANVIEQNFPQSGGEPIDGVIAVDPIGLAALLKLTGPITVAGWPGPITAQNVVDVTLHQVYDVYGGDPTRVEVIGDVAHRAMDIATTGDLGSPARIAQVLGRAARNGHFILSFVKPEEEALAQRLHIGGEVAATRSDSLLVTTQNAGANKVDFYLRRHVAYDATVTPGAKAHTARVQANLDVKLDNTAPAGVTSFALGPWDPSFQPGENRSFVSLYTPLGFTGATLNGQPTQLESDTELGRRVYSDFASVYAATTGVLDVHLDGHVRLGKGGWYTLDVDRQPTLTPDDLTVKVRVPDGYRIVATRGGLHQVNDRQATVRLTLAHAEKVGIRIERSSGEGLWDRLEDGR